MVNINNTELQSMTFDGQEVNTWIHNGITVWEKNTFNLQDFEYIENGNDTYTLTAWKETYQGISSTECIIPNDDRIIL